MRERRQAQSVAKAAHVLRALASVPAPQSVRQLADRMDIPRSTLHAICTTLCHEGLLEQVPGAGYRLGPTLVELGGHVISRTGLLAAAEGVLCRLSPVPDGEVHLSQFVNGWVVYLHRQGGAQSAAKTNAVGLSVPAHLTGSGRAMLAAMPWERALAEVRRACAGRGHAPPDPVVLAAALTRVRELGYAVCDTFRPGRVSVAAPIRDTLGTPVGAVSCVGPAALYSPAVVRKSGLQVLEVAGQIGRALR